MGNQIKSIDRSQALSEPAFPNYTSTKYDTFVNEYVPSKTCQSPKTMISTKIVQIAAGFWNDEMSTLSIQRQLEISVAIYSAMAVKLNKIKRIFKKYFHPTGTAKIETIALKFVNTTGWLIRALLRNDDNLTEMLSILGAIHGRMHIDSTHFSVLVESLHETFTYYFPNSYKIQQKYAMDYTFARAMEMMMVKTIGCDYVYCFLKSLDICLLSSVATEYLFKYLQQQCRDEIAIYLTAIKKFDNQTTDKRRFMTARNIIEVSIDEKSNLSLNISDVTRQNMLATMHHFEHIFAENQFFRMESDIFQGVTQEVYNIILKTHWNKFVTNVKKKIKDNNL